MYVPLIRVTAWARGRYSLRVCRLCRLLNPRLCLFYLKTMINNINNFGTINFYESNHSESKKDQANPRQIEDIEPVTEYFKHLTRKCIDDKRVDTVNAEIKAACKGTAEGLWRTLWNNENLGYVAVEPVDATTLYKDIEEFYGTLPFKERQFRSARTKR